MVVDESSNNAEDFERLLELDRQIPDYFDEGPRTSASRRQDDADRRHDQLSNIASPSENAQVGTGNAVGRARVGLQRTTDVRADHF